MIRLFGDNPVWQLIMQSDAMSMGVLGILLLLSIASWTIFMVKWCVVRMRKRQFDQVLEAVEQARSVDDLLSIAQRFNTTLAGVTIARSVQVLRSILERRPATITQERKQYDIEFLESGLAGEAESVIALQESYLPFLSTTASVSPLLGLFGTVWGLIHAFIRMSERQAADIVTVAPGIAEALTTTLAGLLVAIPALVMYNYLLVQVRLIEQRVVTLNAKLLLIMHDALVR